MRRKDHSNRFKRIRAAMRKQELYWRERIYELLTISIPARRKIAKRIRLKATSGRALYHRIKSNVQANRA